MTFSRRRFLSRLGLAAGGALAGSAIGPGRSRAGPVPSRVVCVTDGRAWAGDGWTDDDLDGEIIEGMIARALVELTGDRDPSRALAALIPGVDDPAARFGIKVNCVNRHLPSHPAVTTAFARLLCTAGAAPDRVIVFDRTDGELFECGYPVGDGDFFRCIGSDHAGAGYEDRPDLAGGAVRLSAIVTGGVDHLVSLPVLKNHQMAGVTLSLKNQFGSIDRPEALHGDQRDCSPGIAELNALPALRDRFRLALIDATFATCVSGLGARPDFAPMALLVSADPVAADWAGQELINRRRARDGLDPIDARHIRDAAARGLGLAGPDGVELIEVATGPPPSEKPKPWEQAGPSGCSTTTGTAAAGAVLLGASLLAAGAKRQGGDDREPP